MNLVGSDMQPGLYTAVVPDVSFNCYWARMSGVSGDFEELLANDNQSVGTIVEIRPGDVAFKATGCGTWTAA